MRHGLGPESADWAREVNETLMALESDVILSRQPLSVLNDQVRQQQILAGNVSNRLQESSPSGLSWTVNSALPSGGGFVGSNYAVSAPDWATGVLVNTIWVESESVPGVAEAEMCHSLAPLTSFSRTDVSGWWDINDGVTLNAQYGFTGKFITFSEEQPTLYSRLHVLPGASGAISATFNLGVVWVA